ncbi:MAG TPA: 50S ribosomal protein L36 [Candidatus Saccharimonadales bacterium]|nr:50S ribosomal protein L36 [Candidatus Saccharimonadales bacterium]
MRVSASVKKRSKNIAAVHRKGRVYMVPINKKKFPPERRLKERQG